MSGKNRRTKAMAAAVGAMMLLSVIGCGTNSTTDNLMVGIQAVSTEKVDLDDTSYIISTADFSMEFFRNTMSGKENIMISPASLLTALSMTENGAKGKTRSEMLKICNSKKEEYASLKRAEKQSKKTFSIANSIWIRDEEERFQVNKEFLENNAKTANAEIFTGDFKEDTLNDINRWVKKNTKGMIPKLLDELKEDDMMHLINTVAFKDKWKEPYESEDINEGEFTDVNGNVQQAVYMNSEEERYLKDEKAVGFIKPYKNGFSFVAILPNEGIALESYMKGMTGSKFLNLIKNAENTKVSASIPKFKNEYKLEAKEYLMKMGMKEAFDETKADFTSMGTVRGGNLYIDSVLQKTYIEVDEQGTKASAATDIMMAGKCMSEPEPSKVVDLNRPFIYAIIDNTTSLPVFMGAVTNM